MFALAIISIFTGLIVGVLSGLLGIGGGTILVSIFNICFGMSPIHSTATSLATIIPTSISGCITHIHNKTCIVGIGICAGIGGACMSPLGVWLASISPGWLVMVIAATVIAYSAITMLRKGLKLYCKNKHEKEEEFASAIDMEASAIDMEKGDEVALGNAAAHGETAALKKGVAHDGFRFTKRVGAISVLIGFVAGVVSGYVGVGGGFIMIPMFMSVLKIPMKKTSGSSLIAVALLAIPGTITQMMLGNVEWLVGLFVAVGSIPGAIIGSKLISRVSEVALRIGFACLLLVTAILLVVNQFI